MPCSLAATEGVVTGSNDVSPCAVTCRISYGGSGLATAATLGALPAFMSAAASVKLPPSCEGLEMIFFFLSERKEKFLAFGTKHERFK